MQTGVIGADIDTGGTAAFTALIFIFDCIKAAPAHTAKQLCVDTTACSIPRSANSIASAQVSNADHIAGLFGTIQPQAATARPHSGLSALPDADLP